MTISPPSNVRLPQEVPQNIPCRVLAHGVDTLVLAVNVRWLENYFFEKLSELKMDAEEAKQPATGKIMGLIDQADCLFLVAPFGRDGYQWLVSFQGCDMRIGNWLIPQQRPSVMVELRSETLWTHGVEESVSRILGMLKAMGGEIESVKLSRVDVCVDVLLADLLWSMDLLTRFNTRASKIDPHLSRGQLTGFSIGRGAISARLYDKPLEIAEKSRKFWMFDIWGLDSVPEDCKVIRVEFQLRREALRELGLDEYCQLEAGLPHLWSRCSKEWLKLVDDNAKHSSRQKLLPWWKIVQAGLPGSQQAYPLVRARAISEEATHLHKLILGSVASLTALYRQGDLLAVGEVLDLHSHVAMTLQRVCSSEWDDDKFTQKVKEKQAKRMRCEEKFAKATRLRAALGICLKQHNAPPPVLGDPPS